MGCSQGKAGGDSGAAVPNVAAPVMTADSAKGAAAAATPAAPAAAGEKKLDVINAAKMDMKDLTEKEPFHSVYTLGDVLGRGNYSTVKKGVRNDDPKKTVYAVKCIKESALTNEDREALKIETAILKGMDCPHIIKLYGFYEEKKEKMFYIVTEFVGGGELFDRIIAKEFYSEADAQKLVATVAIAIKYCHDRGVVHRDLKPENILLTSKDDDESIKIADFGFAKQYDTSSDDALSTSCGTPGYVAPEILNGKKYGKEVDMWSFGVIIFILLCGYPPFHHDNQKQLFALIRNGQFKFDPDYWGEVSEQAKDLIRKLLVVDGSKRLTIDQLLDHEWLKGTASNKTLPDVRERISKFSGKQQFKVGVQAVIAQNRIKKLTEAAKDAAASQDSMDPPGAPDASNTSLASQ